MMNRPIRKLLMRMVFCLGIVLAWNPAPAMRHQAPGIITASVAVSQERDSLGNTTVYFTIRFSGGKTPEVKARPGLRVYDAAGNVVHRAKFEYG